MWLMSLIVWLAKVVLLLLQCRGVESCYKVIEMPRRRQGVSLLTRRAQAQPLMRVRHQMARYRMQVRLWIG